MDKIAVLSDVHGNIPALNAVLEDIEKRGADKIVCLGDMIGKGPNSGQAVDICRERCHFIVKGNWEDFITKSDALEGVRWLRRQLGEERLKYLSELPRLIEFYISGKLVRLFHAHPEDVYIRTFFGSTLEDKLRLFQVYDNPEILERREADIVGYGDIHRAYIQYVSSKVVFNTGSVGNPLDIPEASYVLLEGDYQSRKPVGYTISFVRVQYDIDAAVRHAEGEEMQEREAYIRELRTGIFRGRKN